MYKMWPIGAAEKYKSQIIKQKMDFEMFCCCVNLSIFSLPFRYPDGIQSMWIINSIFPTQLKQYNNRGPGGNINYMRHILQIPLILQRNTFSRKFFHIFPFYKTNPAHPTVGGILESLIVVPQKCCKVTCYKYPLF